jgi:cytoskeletal protein CcmA (bactofilin family)
MSPFRNIARASAWRQVIARMVLLLAMTIAGRADAADRHPNGPVMVGGELTFTDAAPAPWLVMAGSIVINGGHTHRLLTAAGTIQITGGTIDALAASAGTLDLISGTLGDVAAAAGTLRINTRIDGSLRAAAGTVALTRDTVIGGDAYVSGGDVAIDGSTGGDLTVSADHVALAGTVGGNVRVDSRDVRIAAGTHIKGDLVAVGDTVLAIPEDAHVDGQILHQARALAAPTRSYLARTWRHLLRGLWIVAAFALCGGLVMWAVPALTRTAEANFVTAFPASLLTGFIAFAALPVAMVILLITVIGIPVALIALAAAFVVVGLGLLTACRWAGSEVRRRMGHAEPADRLARLGWIAVGCAAYLIVGIVPVLGALAQGVALLAGAGAVLLTVVRRGAPIGSSGGSS